MAAMSFEWISPIELVIAALWFGVPVVAGLGIAWFLRLLGKVAAERSGRALADTFPHALIWPVLLASWLSALYLCSSSLRGLPYEWVRRTNWEMVDRWLIAAGIVVAFVVGYRALLFSVRFAALRAGRDPLDFMFVRRVLAALMVVLAAATALNSLGVNIGPVLASLGIAGLAVALALQDTLANYFAGLTITMDRTFKPGDFVRLEGGQEGFVEAIGWRSTRLRPLAESVVIVPNTKLTTGIVMNLHLPDPAARVYVDCGVSYESNLDAVEAVAIQTAREVAARTPGADVEFEPLVRFKNFGESNIEFTVILRAADFDKSFLLKSEMIKALHRRFAETGIGINYPVRQLVNWPQAEQQRPAREPEDVI